MRTLTVKLKDENATFFDLLQPTGSLLIIGAVTRQVAETQTIKDGVLGGALLVVSVVEPTEATEVEEQKPFESKEIAPKEAKKAKK